MSKRRLQEILSQEKVKTVDPFKDVDDKINDQLTSPGGLSTIDPKEYSKYVSDIALSGNDTLDRSILNELRAANQSSLAKISNGLIKFGGKTVSNVAGAVGMLGALPFAAYKGDFTKLYDNAFERGLDDFSKLLDKTFPNYRSKMEEEYALLQNLGDVDFWADDFLGGASFLAGAYLSEVLTAGAATYANIGKAAKFLKAKPILHRSVRIDDYKAFAKKNQYYNTAVVGRQILTGAGFEAGVEARHFRNEAIEKAKKDFKLKNQREANEEELKEITKTASKAANGVFAANLALVSASNFIVLDKVYGKPLSKLLPKSKTKLKFNKDGTVSKPTGYLPFLKDVGKKVLKPVTEAREEFSQNMVKSIATQYVLNKYDDLNPTYGLLDATLEGYRMTMQDKEAYKEAMIGFILGAVGLPGMFPGAVQDAIKEYRQGTDLDRKVNAYNTNNKNLEQSVKNLVRQGAINEVEPSDFFTGKNQEAASILSWMDSRYNVNRLDTEVEHLLETIDNTDDASFAEEYGYNSSENIKQRKEEVKQSLIKAKEDFLEAKSLTEKVLQVDNEDVKEGLTFSLYMLKNVESRRDSINKKLGEFGITEFDFAKTRELNAYDRLEAEQMMMDLKKLDLLESDLSQAYNALATTKGQEEFAENIEGYKIDDYRDRIIHEAYIKGRDERIKFLNETGNELDKEKAKNLEGSVFNPRSKYAGKTVLDTELNILANYADFLFADPEIAEKVSDEIKINEQVPQQQKQEEKGKTKERKNESKKQKVEKDPFSELEPTGQSEVDPFAELESTPADSFKELEDVQTKNTTPQENNIPLTTDYNKLLNVVNTNGYPVIPLKDLTNAEFRLEEYNPEEVYSTKNTPKGFAIERGIMYGGKRYTISVFVNDKYIGGLVNPDFFVKNVNGVYQPIDVENQIDLINSRWNAAQKQRYIANYIAYKKAIYNLLENKGKPLQLKYHLLKLGKNGGKVSELDSDLAFRVGKYRSIFVYNGVDGFWHKEDNQWKKVDTPNEITALERKLNQSIGGKNLEAPMVLFFMNDRIQAVELETGLSQFQDSEEIETRVAKLFETLPILKKDENASSEDMFRGVESYLDLKPTDKLNTPLKISKGNLPIVFLDKNGEKIKSNNDITVSIESNKNFNIKLYPFKGLSINIRKNRTSGDYFLKSTQLEKEVSIGKAFTIQGLLKALKKAKFRDYKVNVSEKLLVNPREDGFDNFELKNEISPRFYVEPLQDDSSVLPEEQSETSDKKFLARVEKLKDEAPVARTFEKKKIQFQTYDTYSNESLITLNTNDSQMITNLIASELAAQGTVRPTNEDILEAMQRVQSYFNIFDWANKLRVKNVKDPRNVLSRVAKIYNSLTVNGEIIDIDAEQKYETNISNAAEIKKGVEKVLKFYSETPLEELDDEDAQIELFSKSGDRYGGLNKESQAFKAFIGLTSDYIDYFGIGIKVKSSLPGYKVYNAFIEALKNVPRENMLKVIQHYGENNENVGIVVNRLLDHIKTEIGKNNLTQEELEQSSYYNLFVNAFNKTESKYIQVNVENNKYNVFDAARDTSSTNQVDKWRSNFRANNITKDELTQLFKTLGNYIPVKPPKDAKKAFDRVETYIDNLQNALKALGIDVSRGLVKYSVYTQLDPNKYEFVNSYIDAFSHVSNMEILNEDFLTGLKSSGLKLFDPSSGAYSRLVRLAKTNTFFDERVRSHSIQNAEGERIYTIANYSYDNKLIQILSNIDSNVLQDPEKFKIAVKEIIPNPYLAEKYRKFVQDLPVDQIEQVTLMGQRKGDDNNSYHRLDTIQKLLYSMALFEDSTSTFNKDGKRLFLTQIIEAKNTQKAYAVKIGDYYRDGGYTNKAVNQVKRFLTKEINRIKDVQEELNNIENSTIPFIKGYHYAKQRIILKDGNTFRVDEVYDENGIFERYRLTEVDVDYTYPRGLKINMFEGSLIKEIEDKIHNNEQVDNKLLERAAMQYISQKHEEFNSLITNIKKSQLSEFYKNNQNNIYNFFMNDMIASMFITTINYGDVAIGHKHANDVVKRNSGLIAAGNSFGSGSSRVAIIPTSEIELQNELLQKNNKNTEQDVQDAQSYVSPWWYVNIYLARTGKLDNKTKKIYQKLRVGSPLSQSEIRHLDSRAALLNDRKIVIRDTFNYIKTSAHTLTRAKVSKRKGNINTLIANYEELDNAIDIEQKRKIFDEKIAPFYEALPGMEYQHEMLNSMERNSIDIISVDSASKMVSDISEGYVNNSFNLKPFEISNEFIREQVKTDNLKTEIIHGTQLQNLVWSENNEELANRYLDLLAERIKLGNLAKNKYFNKDNVDYQALWDEIRNGLSSSNPNVQLEELLEVVGGKPMYSWNLPIITKKVEQALNSFLSKKTLSHKVPGSKLTLIADHTRNLRWGLEENGIYYGETVIPKYLADKLQIKVGDIVTGIRIPTQDKHSMVNLKVVDFYPDGYSTSVAVPNEVLFLSGADFDIDSLFVRSRPTGDTELDKVNNELFDLEIQMMMNESNKDIAATKASMDLFEQAEEDLSDVIDINPAKGIYSITDKLKADETNTTGKAGIGPAALFNVIFQKLYKYKVNSNLGFTPQPTFNSLTNNGVRINDIISQVISAMTDNAKVQYAGKFNLSMDDLSPFLTLISLGVDFNTALLYIQLQKDSTTDIKGIQLPDGYKLPENLKDLFKDKESVKYKSAVAFVKKSMKDVYEFSNQLTALSTIISLNKGLPSTSKDMRRIDSAINRLGIVPVIITKKLGKEWEVGNGKIEFKSGNKFYEVKLTGGNNVAQVVFNDKHILSQLASFYKARFDSNRIFLKGNGTYTSALNDLSKFIRDNDVLDDHLHAYVVAKQFEKTGYTADESVLKDTIEDKGIIEYIAARLRDTSFSENTFLNVMRYRYDEQNKIHIVEGNSRSHSSPDYDQQIIDAAHEMFTAPSNLNMRDLYRRSSNKKHLIDNLNEYQLANLYSRLLFDYWMAKDGGMFRNNSVAKHFHPIMFKHLADSINISDVTIDTKDFLKLFANNPYHKQYMKEQDYTATGNPLVLPYVARQQKTNVQFQQSTSYSPIDRLSLKDALKDSFNLTEEQAKAISYVYDRVAHNWAIKNSKSPRDWYEDKIKSIQNGLTDEVLDRYNLQYQDLRDKKAGYDPENNILYAFTNPDVSTPIHELAHMFERDLTDTQRQTVLDWTNENTWNEYVSEKFAVGFEKYVIENEAPSFLKKIFEKFKNWIIKKYNDLLGNPIELNEPMRNLYSQILGDSPIQFQRQSQSIDNTQQVQEVADELSKALNIELKYVNDPNLDYAGYFEKDHVVLNLAKAGLDTAIHEFAHPFIRAIRNQNKGLWRKLVAEVRKSKNGKKVLDELKSDEYYSNLSEDLLLEEAAAELVGRYGKGQIEDGSIKNIFERILQWLKETLEKIGGLTVYDLPRNTSLRDIYAVMKAGNINLTPSDYTLEEFSLSDSVDSYEYVTIDGQQFEIQLGGIFDPITNGMSVSIGFSETEAGYDDINNNTFFKIMPQIIKLAQKNFREYYVTSINFTATDGDTTKRLAGALRYKGNLIFSRRLFGDIQVKTPSPFEKDGFLDSEKIEKLIKKENIDSKKLRPFIEESYLYPTQSKVDDIFDLETDEFLIKLSNKDFYERLNIIIPQAYYQADLFTDFLYNNRENIDNTIAELLGVNYSDTSDIFQKAFDASPKKREKALQYVIKNYREELVNSIETLTKREMVKLKQYEQLIDGFIAKIKNENNEKLVKDLLLEILYTSHHYIIFPKELWNNTSEERMYQKLSEKEVENQLKNDTNNNISFQTESTSSKAVGKLQFQLNQEDIDFYNSQLPGKTKKQKATVDAILKLQEKITSDNEFYYVDGKPLKRVSNFLQEDPYYAFDGDSDLYENNREWGNQIDQMLESIILGKDKEETLNNIDENYISREAASQSYDSLKEIIDEFPNAMFMTQVATYNKDKNLAGTIDLLVIYPDGKTSVVDLKTSDKTVLAPYVNEKGYTTSYTKKFGNKASKKEKHEAQISLYAHMLNHHGIEVDSVSILPFKVETENGVVISGEIEDNNNSYEILDKFKTFSDYNSKADPFSELETSSNVDQFAELDSVDQFSKLDGSTPNVKGDYSQYINRIKLLLGKRLEEAEATGRNTFYINEILSSIEGADSALAVSSFIQQMYTTILGNDKFPGYYKIFTDKLDDLESSEDKVSAMNALEAVRSVVNIVKEDDLLRELRLGLKEYQEDSLASQLMDVMDKVDEMDLKYRNVVPGVIAEELAKQIPTEKLSAIDREIRQLEERLQKLIDTSAKQKYIDAQKKHIADMREKYYVDGKLDPVEMIKREILKGQYKDIGVLDKWLTPAVSIDNSFLPTFALTLKNAFEKSRLKGHNLAKEMRGQFEKFLGNRNLLTTPPENLYKDFITTIQIGGKEVLSLVSPIDYGTYRAAEQKMFKLAEKIENENERREFMSTWYKQNTENRPEQDVRENGVTVIEGRKTVIKRMKRKFAGNTFEFNKWLNSNTIDENTFIKDLAMPKLSKYSSEQYKKMENKDYYLYLLGKYTEAQNRINKPRDKSYERFILPMVSKSILDKIREDNPKEYLKYELENLFEAKEEDYNTENLESVTKTIPVMYYNAFMDQRNVTKDITFSILKFAASSFDYQQQVKYSVLADNLVDLVNKTKPAITNSQGYKVLSKAAKLVGLEDSLDKYLQKHDNNIAGLLEAFVDIHIYGKRRMDQRVFLPILNKEIDLGKVANTLMTFGSFTQIGGNPLLSVANALQGRAGAMIESNASKVYNKREWIRASNIIYEKHIPDFFKDSVSPYNKSKIGMLVDHYDAVQGEFRDNFGKRVSRSITRDKLSASSWFALQNIGEHHIQVSSLIAALNSKKLDNGKTLYEAYMDGSLDINYVDEAVRDQLHATNKRLHGVYNKFDAPIIERYWWGRLLMMYRKWLVPGFKFRFKAKGFDYEFGDFTTGTYRTFYTKLFSDTKDLINYYTKNESNMTDTEKQAVLRATMEHIIIAATGFLVLIMTRLQGSIDDDHKEMYYLTLYWTLRLNSEMSVYGALGNPRTNMLPSTSEMISTFRSPSAMFTTVNKAMRLYGYIARDLGNLVTGQDIERYKRDTGMFEKGDSKTYAAMLKLLGLNKNLTDPEEALKGLLLIKQINK